ncbi:hypothetical protein [Serratia odorifera]|jgi:hypothetical protein|nr:hypothetical protein [Serratia odorifera]MBJ2066376.1 hypothetical protein [Serratia odorifera]PNK90472.1 hypothetical protein CEQ31_012610 [Serratia odorifera]RII71582.1 hypothetical protein DX901_13720 [Serratia odorifera]VDZ59444.1 Uncharacterised protein [Serratia odorifera]HEJ9097363.1 hypothetical protein [Serratia odorifera]
MRTLLLALSVIILSGCGINEELDSMILEQHKKKCDDYGFQRGSDAYANCLMRQAEMEDADEQKMLDREAKTKK